MKIKNLAILLMVFSVSLVSCNKSKDTNKNLKQGDTLDLINNVELDYDNAFFDDFSNGVNHDNWYIGNQAWGGSNGGVIPENVSYTDDGILLLRGNGGYYQQNELTGVGDVKDGRYTGAALISKFLVQSGRYEIKMKVLPRLGACTAFWTYAYEFTNELNHEIDIELPGGNQSGVPTFEKLLNTNYHKENRSHSQDIKVADALKMQELYLNDGEWHTFGFDWYSSEEKIIYYIDNKITAISENFIPYLQCRLWIGVWFPVSSGFVGQAEFETDYMQVDYVKYIPFKNQKFEVFNPSVNGYANDNQYPTIPQTLQTVNKLANGTFEYVSPDNAHFSGWILDRYLDEDKPVEQVCYFDNTAGINNSHGLVIKDGGVASQDVDAVYHGFEHDLSFKAKGKGTVIITYYSTSTTSSLLRKTINVESEEFETYTLNLTAPEQSQMLRVEIDTFNGSTIQVDDISLIQK